jgi:hypothetical protein
MTAVAETKEEARARVVALAVVAATGILLQCK